MKSQINVRRLFLGCALIFCACSCLRGESTLLATECCNNLTVYLTASPAPPTDVSITQGPKGRLTVKEQSVLQIPCAYQLPDLLRQSNSVTLRWRKDGKTLRLAELGQTSSTTSEPQLETLLREDARLTLNKETGTLHFASVLASDAGVYQCQLLVEGQSAVSSGSGTLEVIEQLKFMPQPTSKNLELGSVSKVHCKAQGTPVPQVKWMRVSAEATHR